MELPEYEYIEIMLPEYIYIYIYIYVLSPTWTPKVCKLMAFWAIIKGLGLLFYILLGFR